MYWENIQTILPAISRLMEHLYDSRGHVGTIKRSAIALALVLCSCSSPNEFRVTFYRNARGAEAYPWADGCLATVESRTQKVAGLGYESCKKIQIGDKAVFNHDGDKVFWVNDWPYTVKSAEAK